MWGQWLPSEDDHRHHALIEGEMHLANPQWLDNAMLSFGKRLVYTITFSKFPSSKRFDERTGAKAVFVGLRLDEAELRIWPAREASAHI